ncbi:hypothetical protein BC827DRAFT_1233410 [Russula dissimulans]|nr:hypothetical protein BC827DRAFT_1233410 [Russula dissimulans]
MGLSGRKSKQRIGKDPRNLSWVDDANRFGKAYLAKFGWDASKGLGSSGEGRTTAVKAGQKLDMLGIGMQHQKDPNGLAWRQNRDFENVLRRLNDGTGATGPFHKARESESREGAGTVGEGDETGDVGRTDDDDDADDADARKEKEKEKKKKKKKRKAAAEADEGDPTDKKERKKRKKSKSRLQSTDGDGDNEPSQPLPPPGTTIDAPAPGPASIAAAAADAVTAPTASRAPPRTHRARIIAAKRMAAANSAALAEILGIPPSSSSSTSPFSSSYPSAIATPTVATRSPSHDLTASESESEAQDSSLQKLTTSSQSVGEYFKAKLAAMATGQTLSAAAGVAPAPVARGEDGADDRAGSGLGGGALRVALPAEDEEPMRGGIGASSSSRFAAMFALGQPTTEVWEEGAGAAAGRHAHDDDSRKAEKKRAKEERRIAREERRQKRVEAGRAGGTVRDVFVGEASDGGGVKKTLDGRSADTHPSKAGEMEAIPTKKRKDRKSMKHRRAED